MPDWPFLKQAEHSFHHGGRAQREKECIPREQVLVYDLLLWLCRVVWEVFPVYATVIAGKRGVLLGEELEHGTAPTLLLEDKLMRGAVLNIE